MAETADRVPAFHRAVLVTPEAGKVAAWVEDDYHHMGVILRHDGTTIAAVGSEMIRAPWSTCPGAPAQLRATFEGVALADAARRGEKLLNCTHLHDMAVLAAAHARDERTTRYDITVTDASAGQRIADIASDGTLVLRLIEQQGIITEPSAAAGKTLFQLGDWISTLNVSSQEVARLLRWAAIIAHGRARPIDQQSDATRMPPNCFTFQEARRYDAERTGEVIDFTTDARQPLATEQRSSGGRPMPDLSAPRVPPATPRVATP